MSKSRSIPEELIKIKADQIGKKRESQGKVKTPEVDLVIARQYLEKHWWEVFCWKVNTLPGKLIIIGVIAFILCAYVFHWSWTGFVKDTTTEVTRESKTETSSIEKFTKTTKDQSAKTLWDWLDLLAVPILIVVIGYQLEQREKKRTEKQAQEQKEAEQILKQDQLRAEIRTDYIKRLGMSYRKVKAARRALRAAGLTTKYGNPPDTLSEAQIDAYKQEMQHLNHAQLELEALKIEAKHLPVFASINQLAGDLRKMEDYLREILKEYEETSIILDSGTSIYWHRLKLLNEFTESGRRKTKSFHTEFSHPYDCAIKQISQNLINY